MCFAIMKTGNFIVNGCLQPVDDEIYIRFLLDELKAGSQ